MILTHENIRTNVKNRISEDILTTVCRVKGGHSRHFSGTLSARHDDTKTIILVLKFVSLLSGADNQARKV